MIEMQFSCQLSCTRATVPLVREEFVFLCVLLPFLHRESHTRDEAFINPIAVTHAHTHREPSNQVLPRHLDALPT